MNSFGELGKQEFNRYTSAIPTIWTKVATLVPSTGTEWIIIIITITFFLED